ncbi:MAG: 2Fe-2S iron-sulfur cluster-binding protein [Anaerolineales bacterium]
MKRGTLLRIHRAAGWADFRVEVRGGAYVLEALEEAWRQDPTLLFRHSCHHGSCGTCGMRINGRERLACLTPIAVIGDPGRPIRLEPLRNLPLIGDLLVDLSPLAQGIETTNLPLTRMVGDGDGDGTPVFPFVRFENCIECGLCLSACPIAGHDPRYLGPALLAAAGRIVQEPRASDPGSALAQVDREHGVWRCHAAFDCTEVCPTGVDPAGLILGLRGRLLAHARKGKAR